MFRRFRVNGSSMEPTYHEGDRIIAIRYGVLCAPKAGDVAIVRDPRDGRLLLKRLVRTEPDGRFYAAGDNERASTDSKEFGALSRERIVAKVLWRYYQMKDN